MTEKVKKTSLVFLLIALCGVLICLFSYAFSTLGERKIPLDSGSKAYSYSKTIDNVYIKAKNTVIRISKGENENYIRTKNIPKISYSIDISQRKLKYSARGGIKDFFKTIFGMNKNEKYLGIYRYIPEKINGSEKEILISVSKSRIVRYHLELEDCTVFFSDIDTQSDYIVRGKNNAVYFENVSGESYISVDENKNAVYFG